MTRKTSKNDSWEALTKDPIVLDRTPLPRYVLVILGIFVAWVVFLTAWPLFLWHGPPVEAKAAASAVVAVAASVYAGMVFGVNRLTLDFRNRSLIREVGVFPFIYRRRGCLDDFAHLQMHVSVQQVQSGDRSGHTYTVEFCNLRLVPKEGAESRGKSRVRAVTMRLVSPTMPNTWSRSLAEKIGLPLKIGPTR